MGGRPPVAANARLPRTSRGHPERRSGGRGSCRAAGVQTKARREPRPPRITHGFGARRLIFPRLRSERVRTQRQFSRCRFSGQIPLGICRLTSRPTACPTTRRGRRPAGRRPHPGLR
jgi:hypothetical protein